jgi:hypothetical protein
MVQGCHGRRAERPETAPDGEVRRAALRGRRSDIQAYFES